MYEREPWIILYCILEEFSALFDCVCWVVEEGLLNTINVTITDSQTALFPVKGSKSISKLL